MSDRRRRPKPWVEADYPRQRGLTRAEAMDDLRHGPSLSRFRGWVGTGDLTVTPDVLMPWERYELLHVYRDAARGGIVQAALMYDDAEHFRWALGALYGAHVRGSAVCCLPGNEHLGTFYFVYPSSSRIELERDQDYEPSTGVLRFPPREGGLR